jgi:hypothetical protein
MATKTATSTQTVTATEAEAVGPDGITLVGFSRKGARAQIIYLRRTYHVQRSVKRPELYRDVDGRVYDLTGLKPAMTKAQLRAEAKAAEAAARRR